MKHVFFPPISKYDPPYPINPCGFLPNSAILQQLRKSDEDKLLAKQWTPPKLSDKQRKLMNEVEEVRGERGEGEGVVVYICLSLFYSLRKKMIVLKRIVN